jgi:hypothetical protein
MRRPQEADESAARAAKATLEEGGRGSFDGGVEHGKDRYPFLTPRQHRPITA